MTQHRKRTYLDIATNSPVYAALERAMSGLDADTPPAQVIEDLAFGIAVVGIQFDLDDTQMRDIVDKMLTDLLRTRPEVLSRMAATQNSPAADA